MLGGININSGDNILYEIFKQNGKDYLLDTLCTGFSALNMGSVYDNLCNKLKRLFDDQTNRKKYFNNLVNIIEIVDWAATNCKGFDGNFSSYFSLLWDKLKREDKIGGFVELVKNFDGTGSKYMFVVKDANGNEFKTPGLQITTAQILFDNDEVISQRY